MKNLRLLFVFISIFIICTHAYSQALEIESTTDGILIPKMTEANRNNISSPDEGTMIYQTNGTKGFYFYNGSSWSAVGGVSSTILTGRLFGNYNSGPRYTAGEAACVAASETQCTMIIPRSGTIENLYVLPSASTAGTVDVTVRINGTNTALKVNIPGGTSTVVSDLSNSINVNAGDRYTIQVNVPGSTNPGVNYFATMEFK